MPRLLFCRKSATICRNQNTKYNWFERKKRNLIGDFYNKEVISGQRFPMVESDLRGWSSSGADLAVRGFTDGSGVGGGMSHPMSCVMGYSSCKHVGIGSPFKRMSL